MYNTTTHSRLCGWSDTIFTVLRVQHYDVCSLADATYFFKNRGFWKFNDLRMSVEQKEPKSIGRFWFNCSGTGDRQSTSNRNSVQVSAKGARGGRMQSEVQGDNNDAHAGRAHSQSWSLSLVAAAFLAVFLRAFP